VRILEGRKFFPKEKKGSVYIQCTYKKEKKKTKTIKNVSKHVFDSGVCVCVCVCVFMCLHAHKHTYIHTHTCMHACTHARTELLFKLDDSFAHLPEEMKITFEAFSDKSIKVCVLCVCLFVRLCVFVCVCLFVCL